MKKINNSLHLQAGLLAFVCLSYLLSTSACSNKHLPQTTQHATATKIVTENGPEDIVLDTKFNRLIVSCNDHRLQKKAPEGTIYIIHPKTNESYPIERTGEPQDLPFHPHGIDFVCENDHKCYLYVVSHDDIKNKHYILKYLVEKTALQFVDSFTHQSLIPSPNAVTALKNGSFYVSNDRSKRNALMESALKQKKSFVSYCNAQKEWKMVARKLAFPNGITNYNNTLYLATTQQNKLFAYTMYADGSLSKRKEITTLKGQDNLRFQEGDTNKLLVAAHLNMLKFVQHFRNAKKPAPTAVYEIDVQNGEQKLLYFNKGEEISAGATGLVHDGYLYIAQVFQPFILKVSLK